MLTMYFKWKDGALSIKGAEMEQVMKAFETDISFDKKCGRKFCNIFKAISSNYV